MITCFSDGLTGQTLSCRWALSRPQGWKGRHRKSMLRHWGSFLSTQKSNIWTWKYLNTGTKSVYQDSGWRLSHEKSSVILGNAFWFTKLAVECDIDIKECVILKKTWPNFGRLAARLRPRRAPQRGCQVGTCQVHNLANTLYQIGQRHGKDGSTKVNDPQGYGK